MTEYERWREPLSALPGPDSWKLREKEGWRLVAIEWERPERLPEVDERPIPYGLRISADCRHLEVDPTEKEAMSLIVALIAGDRPLSRIADELNRRGFRTRAGTDWTQLKIFQLLPRIIEFGPEILAEKDWSESKRRVLAVVS
jgi:Recombinase